MLFVPDIILGLDPADNLISRASMARYILRLMATDYSETYHFVSWTDEMARSLWDDVQGIPQEAAFGQTNLSEEERELFRNLATVADAWWLDPHGPGGFLPMSEWLSQMAEPNPSPANGE